MIRYTGEDKALDEWYEATFEKQRTASKKAVDDINAELQRRYDAMVQQAADKFADGDITRIELARNPWTSEITQVLLDGNIVIDYTTPDSNSDHIEAG